MELTDESVCGLQPFCVSLYPPQWQQWKRTEVNNLIVSSTGQTCITRDCVNATNVLLTLTKRDSFILSLTSITGRMHRKLMFVSILVQWVDREIYLIHSTLSHCCGLSLPENDDVLPDEDYDTLEIRENDFKTYWLTTQTPLKLRINQYGWKEGIR